MWARRRPPPLTWWGGAIAAKQPTEDRTRKPMRDKYHAATEPKRLGLITSAGRANAQQLPHARENEYDWISCQNRLLLPPCARTASCAGGCGPARNLLLQLLRELQ